MSSPKSRVRAALGLETTWQQAAAWADAQQAGIVRIFDESQAALRRAQARLAKARIFGLSAVLPALQRAVLTQFSHLQRTMDRLLALPEKPVAAPTARWFLAELQQIEADVGNLEIDLKTISIGALTEPITLEGFELGSFEIRLPWEKAGSATYLSFEVVARGPNRSAVNNDVTHPHVKGARLCAGDAAVPIKRALEQGRLADAFNLVRGVLTTYNPASPFVRLEEWEGTTCADCGRSVSSAELSCCQACGSDVCDDCSSFCQGCDDTRCLGCLAACSVCHQSCCGNCLDLTAATGRSCCANCRINCARCSAVFGADEAAQNLELCLRCRSRPPANTNSIDERPGNAPAPTPTFEETSHATSVECDTTHTAT